MIRPMEGDSPAIHSRFEDPDSLSALIPQLEQAIESAMAASSGRPSGAPPSAQGLEKPPTAGTGQRERGWRQQRVLARLEVVRGVPFYGYHAEEKLFLKVGASVQCWGFGWGLGRLEACLGSMVCLACGFLSLA